METLGSFPCLLVVARLAAFVCGIEHSFQDPAREAEVGRKVGPTFKKRLWTHEPVYLMTSRAGTGVGLVFPQDLFVRVGTGVNDVVVLGASEGGFGVPHTRELG